MLHDAYTGNFDVVHSTTFATDRSFNAHHQEHDVIVTVIMLTRNRAPDAADQYEETIGAIVDLIKEGKVTLSGLCAAIGGPIRPEAACSKSEHEMFGGERWIVKPNTSR